MYAVITIFEFSNNGCCPCGNESSYDFNLKVFKEFEDAKEYAREQFSRSNVDTVLVVPVLAVFSRRG